MEEGEEAGLFRANAVKKVDAERYHDAGGGVRTEGGKATSGRALSTKWTLSADVRQEEDAWAAGAVH